MVMVDQIADRPHHALESRRATSARSTPSASSSPPSPPRRSASYTAGTFSFNSGNGRCPTCGGNGFEHVEMQFLSDVYLRCPDCDGTRYRDEVLEIKREGADGRRAQHRRRARLTVTEALAFFADRARSPRGSRRSPTSASST